MLSSFESLGGTSGSRGLESLGGTSGSRSRGLESLGGTSSTDEGFLVLGPESFGVTLEPFEDKIHSERD